MSAAATAVFAGSLAVAGYVYFGYPLLLWVLARMRPRPHRKAPVRPSLTLIVPAFNEAAVIEAKLRNLLEQDYPRDRLQVLVVSDGSTDETVAIARRFAASGVEVVELERSGKAAALNEGVRRARGEVVAFSDANALLAPSSLARLVEGFADPEVGGVGGNRVYRPRAGADATARGEGTYWRWDRWQKTLETRIGSAFASDGTLHAVRRELYVPIADPAQADDIAISARVPLQGRRLVFEPAAVAYEDEPEEGRDEIRRKVRVTIHSVRALLDLGPGLWRAGFYSLELWSHKLLRHGVAFFLLALLGSNVALAGTGAPWAAALAAQGAFYALALAGFVLRRRPIGRRAPLYVPYYFCLVNGAALAGCLMVLAGARPRAWAPRGGVANGGKQTS